jgi:hypothetical protein
MERFLRRGMPPKNKTTKELRAIAKELAELDERRGRL